MHADKEDKIIKTMKKVCKERENSEELFDALKKIYDHVSKHDNEAPDNRVQSIKNIIDSRWEGSG